MVWWLINVWWDLKPVSRYTHSRYGPGVLGCVSVSLAPAPVTPAVAGVGWPEPPEKVSRVSVSQCWLRDRSRQTPLLSILRDNTNSLEICRSDSLTQTGCCLKYFQTVRVTDRPDHTETWWRRGRRLSRSAEHLRIPQIPVCYLTWQWARRNTRQANYQQLPALLQSKLSGR